MFKNKISILIIIKNEDVFPHNFMRDYQSKKIERFDFSYKNLCRY